MIRYWCTANLYITRNVAWVFYIYLKATFTSEWSDIAFCGHVLGCFWQNSLSHLVLPQEKYAKETQVAILALSQAGLAMHVFCTFSHFENVQQNVWLPPAFRVPLGNNSTTSELCVLACFSHICKNPGRNMHFCLHLQYTQMWTGTKRFSFLHKKAKPITGWSNLQHNYSTHYFLDILDSFEAKY